MKHFCRLISLLDQNKQNKSKLTVLSEYFKTRPAEDCSWTLYFLLGHRIQKTLSKSDLIQICTKLLPLSEWIIEESIRETADTAEAVTLLVKPKLKSENTENLSLSCFVNKLLGLYDLEQSEKIRTVLEIWHSSDFQSALILNKLLVGGLKFNFDLSVLIGSLADISQLSPAVIVSRLNSKWVPTPENFKQLLESKSELEASSIFPVEFNKILEAKSPASFLGSPSDYLIEWKQTSLRVQLILSPQGCMIWTEDGRDLHRAVPEIAAEVLSCFPINTIIDGELIAASHLYEDLKRRLLKKQPSKKDLADLAINFIAKDLIFLEGEDLSGQPLSLRFQKLNEIISLNRSSLTSLATNIDCSTWGDLSLARSAAKHGTVEGISVRALNSTIESGHQRGNWILWKLPDLSILVVLLYFQRNIEPHNPAVSQLTFGVWKGDSLVPIAKLNCLLNREDQSFVSEYISKNTLDKFGPVRTISPNLVFEISFEGTSASSRHKSGKTLKNPRILRLCKELKASNISKIEEI